MSKEGIHTAMAQVMREITSIGKNSKNTAQGFKFRGIDAVYNELHGLLAKHGIITLPQAGTPITEERINKNGTTLRFVQLPMSYVFVHEDGSSMQCHVIGEGMDSGDKATNKAMAIAHKYALLQTFLIPTEDQVDPDAETYEVQPKVAKPVFKEKKTDPHAELVKLMEDNKVTDDDVFAFLKHKGAPVDGIEYIPDLPAGHAKRLIDIWKEVVEFSFSK